MTTRGTEKEKRPPKTGGLSFARTVSNIAYMLRLAHRCAPGLIISQVAVSVFTALTGFLTGSYLLRQVVNGIGAGRSFRELLLLAAGLFGLQLAVGLLSRLFYNLLFEYLTDKLWCNMELLMFRRAAVWELACYENPSFYDKYEKANRDLSDKAMRVLNCFTQTVETVISFAANAALLLTIDPALAAFALLPCLAMPLLSLRNRREYKLNQSETVLGRSEAYCYRAFYKAENAKELRLSRMYRVLVDRFRQATAKGVELYRKEGVSLALLGYLVYAFRNVFASLGAAAYAAYQTIVRGKMGYGDCVVVIPLVNTIAGNVETLTARLGDFRNQAQYVEDVRVFMEYQPKMQENPDGRPVTGGDIELRDVSFRYDGCDRDVLHHVSMTIRRGEKIAIVGQNGAGKTTLVKLLMRLYDVTQGEITLDGTPVQEYVLSQYRADFATVFQDYKCLVLPLIDNVLLRPEREGDEALVREALEKAGLWEKVSALPGGIRTQMTKEFDDKGAVFSGGELQKLAIAHVYTTASDFVILDEPTSALDPIAEAEMYRTMKEVCRDRGMIFISHRLSSATDADRIYLFDNGEIAESGTHAQLMAKNGLYADMFRKQAQNYVDVPAGGERNG